MSTFIETAKRSINEAPHDSYPSTNEDEQLLRNAGIDKHENESLQHYVQRAFTYLMDNDYLSRRELSNLSDKGYSNRTFGINDKFLSYERWYDGHGNSRSWSKPICGYYLCSEWNKWNFHKIEPKFRHWVAQMIRTGMLTHDQS